MEREEFRMERRENNLSPSPLKQKQRILDVKKTPTNTIAAYICVPANQSDAHVCPLMGLHDAESPLLQANHHMEVQKLICSPALFT